MEGNQDFRKIMRQFMPKCPEISFTLVKDKNGQYVGIKIDLNFKICKNSQRWAKDKEKIKNRFKYEDLYVLSEGKGYYPNFGIRIDRSFIWNFAKNVMMLGRYVNCIKFEPASITVFVGPIDHEFKTLTLFRCWAYFVSEVKSNITKMLELGFLQEIEVLYRTDDFPQAQEQAWKLVEIAQKEREKKDVQHLMLHK